MRSYNVITKLTKEYGKKGKEHAREDLPQKHLSDSSEMNSRNSVVIKGSISFLAPKCYQEGKSQRNRSPGLCCLALFKHCLCFLLQLFDKVKYYFQDNEKIKTILKTLQKRNYMSHSLDLANIFLPAMLSFIKI